jgi:alpha-N-arabinofuranosidase
MPTQRVVVRLDEPIAVVRPELHGQFAEHLGACVNDGLWVGERSAIANVGGFRADVLDALTRLRIPLLRWPGGCFADDYHWEDGVGPRDSRPARVNAWWGHNLEDNAFGTQEFLRLCGLLGAKPYLAGNLGSGTPREMKQWVEYCNFTGPSTLARRRGADGSPQPLGVEYWGVGNENWGCGGSMSPEDYATAYKRFATYLGTFTRPPTRMPLFLIACGPNGNNVDWTRRFFAKAGAPAGDWQLHGFAAHYYCGTAGTATEYSVDQWYELLHRAAAVEKLILDQRAALDEIDPQRKIGLIVDEWGTWHPPTPGREPNHLWQQNTLRDALVAAITLDAFNNHADKVVMANIAQVVNVLQAMILTDGDRMVLTPTYHAFDLYRPHLGGTAVRLEMESSATVAFVLGDRRERMASLSGSATQLGPRVTVSLVNVHADLPMEVEIDLGSVRPNAATHAVLTHDDLTAHNTFDDAAAVVPVRSEIDADVRRFTLPPASVNVLQFTLAG